MTLHEAYEKYKHLDVVFSDSEQMRAGVIAGGTCHDLWLAVKAEVEAKRLEGHFIYETAAGHDPIPYNDNADNCQLCGAYVSTHFADPESK